jgi:hypothetical protein
MTKDKKSKKKNKKEKEYIRNSGPDLLTDRVPVEKEQPELEFKDFKW